MTERIPKPSEEATLPPAGAPTPPGEEDTLAAPAKPVTEEDTLAAPATPITEEDTLAAPEPPVTGDDDTVAGARVKTGQAADPWMKDRIRAELFGEGERGPGEPRPGYRQMGDRYRVGPEIARGGLGRILQGEDPRLGRTVAVKQLLGDGQSGRDRFLYEAQVTARLQHPGIVPVYDLERGADGMPFFCMRLVEGESLDQAIARCDSLEDRLRLLPHVADVADALAYAHSRQIIHRDLKPANVLVGRFGETVTIDWGLAKDLSEDAAAEVSGDEAFAVSPGDLTQAGAIMGTLAYMPPEQARGESLDEHADVYALGAMLYHLLCGKRPFAEHSGPALLAKVMGLGEGAGGPTELVELEPSLPPELLAIVGRAMAPDAADRYPSAEEFAEDLRRFQTGRLVQAHDYSAWQLLRSFVRQHRAAFTAGTVAFVGLAIAAGVAAWRIDLARQEAEGAAVVANEQRDRARELAAQSLVERGRLELFQHRYGRASTFLAGAYERGVDTTTVRTLLAEALLPVEAELSSLQAHEANIYGLALGADLLVTSSTDKTIKLWKVADGSPVGVIEGVDPPAMQIQLSPDGTRLLSSAENGVAVWDPKAKSRLWTGAAGDVSFASWDAAGERIVAGHEDGTIVVHDARDGSKQLGLAHGEGSVWSVRFSPDGEAIVSAGLDRKIRLWSSSDGSPLAVLEGHTEQVFDTSFSADGKRLASASGDETARIWDLESGEVVRVLRGHQGMVFDVSHSPSGDRLATASNDGTARLWDTRSGVLLTTLVGHAEGVMRAEFTDDGARLVTSSYDGTARFWDATLGTPPVVVATPSEVLKSLSLSSDGKTAWLGNLDEVIYRVDLADGKTETFAKANAIVAAPQISSDGKLLAAPSLDGKVTVWDTQTREPILELTSHGEQAFTAVIDAEGKRLLTTGSDDVARLWSLPDGVLLTELRGHEGSIDAGQFGPDGERVLTIGSDNTARVWDIDAGTVTTLLKVPVITCGTFSPDGTRILTARGDGTAREWDAATGEVLSVLEGHHDLITSVDYGPDGTLAVTASYDGAAILWDLASSAPIFTMDGHGSPLSDVAFMPGGTSVLVEVQDGRLFDWTIPREERDASAVAKSVAAKVPWRLEGVDLLPRG